MLNRLTLTALVAFSAVSTDLYLPGIPLLVAEFGATTAEGQLTLGIFMVSLAVGQLLYGPLSDHFGRKPVMYAGLVLYIISSLACALAASMQQLLWARFCQGFAAASGPVLARAIVNDSYASREGAKVMALLAASMAVIPMVAPILGSWLLYWFDWRALFYLLMLFGLLVLSGALSLGETNRSIKTGRLSFTGVGRQLARSLKHPAFMGYVLVGGAQFGAMFAWISAASFVVIEQFSWEPEHFGYTFAVVVAGYISGAFLSSRLVSHKDPLWIIANGVRLGVAASLMILLLSWMQTDKLALVLVAMFAVFMASGLSLANAQMGAISLFPQAAGQSSSVFGFCQTGIAALSNLLVAQLYDGTLLPLALIIGLFSGLAAVTFFYTRSTLVDYASRSDTGTG